MAPQHTVRHWLTVCLSIFLGVLCMNAAAIDPGTVKGTFSHGGKAYPLKHVYAWQPYAQAEELWVYVTDAEVPPAAAQDRFKPDELAKENRFRGVKLVINPASPDLKSLKAKPYAPGEGGMLTASGGPQWQRLSVADKRVVGKLKYEGSDWALDAEFSAPVFGSSGSMQTLGGAQAQKSPQAEVLLAFEDAFNSKGVEAAGAYATPELQAEMNEQIKQIGADTFKTMQAAMRKDTARGEARRKQIEKVVVDGDNAVLEARNSPNHTSLVRLAKIQGSWKVAK